MLRGTKSSIIQSSLGGKKSRVLDSTKEYICRAVVTVIDHLGVVSANLDSALQRSDRVSEAEIRINCLRQKVLTHEHYNHSLLISKFRLRGDTQRVFPRYMLPAMSSQLVGKSKNEAGASDDSSAVCSSNTVSKQTPVEVDEDLPLFMYTSYNHQKLPLSTKIELLQPPPFVASEETHTMGEKNKEQPVASGDLRTKIRTLCITYFCSPPPPSVVSSCDLLRSKTCWGQRKMGAYFRIGEQYATLEARCYQSSEEAKAKRKPSKSAFKSLLHIANFSL